ncbi:MAG: hypothetical protein HF975_15410 [ANME-2 cluster archaeon]|nr:hypothetical protein [ANME-2 cluster archaeon]
MTFRRPWHFSERSSGHSRLDSLFLDEGFGTLDSETLDDAPNALESLRLSDITSRYVLRAVDLKDTVVIDLWNAGGQRPAEILIRRRVIRGSDCRWPWHFRAEQQSVQAGIIVFGEDWHTGK